ncbi:MAG TPA: signal peptidase I [Candidatus Hydrogenedentes bacterium]|nr:signal peptidase I [Candidatus Hydrogenedentota bacterium]HPC17996.1 signal peptidase I [Candidatus Hydrogenedentota bacterium]HRT21220.1 signal peptidase I [Candidatus Hydrogenedentota bacterium]
MDRKKSPEMTDDAGMMNWLFGGAGFEWFKSLVIAVGLALIIRWIVAEPFRIPSSSMEPTLHGDPRIMRGDRVFVNKLVYGTRFPLNGVRIPFTKTRIHYADNRIWRNQAPKRWDIVVFKSVEPGAIHTTLVKRVVGMPGERIHIQGGKVFADGKPLELPPDMPPVHYTAPWGNCYGVATDDAHSLVPPDHYLLLGDNSAQSRDGRFFGWVPNERILGRVSCIWWPIPRWRDFTGFSDTGWWRIVVGFTSLLLVYRIFLGRSWSVHVARGKGVFGVDHFLINRWAYGIPVPFTRYRIRKGRMPKRGERVLYRTGKPVAGSPDMALGYVAGLPGERVLIEDGRLVVNGQPVEIQGLVLEEIEVSGPYARSKAKEHSVVPEDCVFILTADGNPQEPWDGRRLGWTPHAQLVGRAVAIWWPPQRWRRLR